MIIVIADTGPLNYLVQIGAVHILPQLFSSITIPPAVVSELLHKNAPQVVRSWAAQPPDWIQIRAPKNNLRASDFGAGESEALSLAIELKAGLILLDDLAARDAATRHGFKSAGTLGLLAQAQLSGLLDFETALSKLRATNYRVSDEIINRVRLQLKSSSA